MKKKTLILSAVVLMAVCGLAFGGAPKSGAKLYKWVDKNGVTQYGSSIPPEYSNQASEQLNAQGQVVKTQAAEKTPEQIAAEAQAQQQAAAQAQAAADQKKHDKVLLDTYTSTADMERDRISKLSSIDAQINVLNGSISSLQSTIADLQDRSNELTNSKKPVPASLQKQMDTAKQQLLSNQQELLYEQKHKQDVNAQFDSDIARFKELTGANPPAGN